MDSNKVYAILPVIALSVSLLVSSCSPSTTPSPTPTPSSVVPGGPGGGAIVQSDSITTGKIVAIRSVANGYPTQIDLEVQQSQNVGSLPNPTKDKVGQVITCNTDQDVSTLKVGQVIMANIKYVGDVPKPGITLYIYNIKPA